MNRLFVVPSNRSGRWTDGSQAQPRVAWSNDATAPGLPQTPFRETMESQYVSTFYQMVVKGLVILGAVAMDRGGK